MYTFDHHLFLALNFDGGECLDRLMLTISGTAMWLPLYTLILWIVYRRSSWRGLLAFVVLMTLALVLSDMVAGIFKHNGVLGNLLPNFEPRLRPMFTPALEGLEITPDSLVAIRRMALDGDWQVHVPIEAVGGRYGTVSAHAATVVALAALACPVVRRRWFTGLMIVVVLLICYSRIYLGKHFPMDLVWGTLVGLVLGFAAYGAFKAIVRKQGVQL